MLLTDVLKPSNHPKSARGLGVVVAFCLFGAAFAQIGMGVSPARFEIIGKRGENLTETIYVFSQNQEQQTVDVNVSDWMSDPEGNLQILPSHSTPFSASGWLTMSLDPFDLSANTAHAVRFSLALPESDELSGSYRTAVVFTTRPMPSTAEGIVSLVRTRAVVVVYVTIQGTEQPAAELQGVTVVADKDSGKRYLVADVVNTGNVYLRLNGELRFVNTAGEVAQRLELPERVLLREGLVRYRLALPEDLPDDVILAQIEIQPQGPAGSYGGPPLYGEATLP